MKYLSDYLQDRQSALIKELQGFFAFSNKQFDENKAAAGLTDDDKIVRLTQGMFIKKENADEFVDRHEALVAECIQQDIAENGIDKIIMRELSNHEAQITMDYSSAYYALDGYGVTKEQVSDVFWDKYMPECRAEDRF